MANLQKLRKKREQCIENKDWQGAIAALSEMISIKPTPSRYNNRGALFAILENYPQAVADFQQALALDPNFAKAKQNFAKYQEKLSTQFETLDTVIENRQNVSVRFDTLDTIIENRVHEPESEMSQATVQSNHPNRIAEFAETRALPAFNKFGRYEIIDEIGQGGMGKVYKARDPKMEREVALKVILPRETSSTTHTDRFLQEVKAIAKISHANIVSIYDFGETPQNFYTMEYIAGKTLSQTTREEQIPPRRIAEILREVCSAIAEAHKRKIIHRDLKPSNILLRQNETPIVMDFGLAKFLEDESGLSRSGDVIGTPAYMSPEQADNSGADERSDIYSIGAIGYEMLTGRPPFQGDSVYNIIFQVTHNDVIRPYALNPGIDMDLEAIVLKCLEKSPARRYQNALELEQDLQRYLAREPIHARTPTMMRQLGKWIGRNKALSLALLAIVLLITSSFMAITYLFIREKNRSRAQNIINEVTEWTYTGRIRGIKFPLIEERLQEVRDIAPRYFMVYQFWGRIYLLQARWDIPNKAKYLQKSMDALKKAIALNPHDHFSMYLLARLYEANNDRETASRYLCQIAKLDPPVLNEYGYVGRAEQCLLEIQNGGNEEKLQQQAIEFYSKAIEYNPMLGCAYNARGEVYLCQGRHEEAEQDFAFALKTMPEFEIGHRNEVRLYLQMGKYQRAFNSLQRYIKYAPENPLAYYELARVICAMRQNEPDPEIARKQKKKALENLEIAFKMGFDKLEELAKDEFLAPISEEVQELLRKYHN